MTTLKKLWLINSAVALVAVMTLSSGCSTTQEFRPTATVMAGAHKSL